jgi:hypothetical protein
LRKLPAVLSILLGTPIAFRAPHAVAQAVYGSLYGARPIRQEGPWFGAIVTATDTSKGMSTTVQTTPGKITDVATDASVAVLCPDSVLNISLSVPPEMR